MTISQLVTATKAELGITEEELTAPRQCRSRKASEARQILMLLIYAETPESKLSRQVIAEMFGYSTPAVQFKAKKKLSKRFQFRKKYEKVESKYNTLKNGITWHDQKKLTT